MMTIVRSEGIEGQDGPNGMLVWRIAFTHRHCAADGQRDQALCADKVMHKEWRFQRRLCLQKRCGCAVTLSTQDIQTVRHVWDVQARLARSSTSFAYASGTGS